MFCGYNILITWKLATVLLSTVLPLFAHTPQALRTGRYPLQSGFKTSDSTIKPWTIPYSIKMGLLVIPHSGTTLLQNSLIGSLLFIV
jgi:hypothetical protein